MTRVGLESSELGSEIATGGAEVSGTATAESTSAGASTECQTKPSIAKFKITVAFDAAPVSLVAGGEGAIAAEAAAAAAAPPAESSSGSTESSSTTETTSTETSGGEE